MEHTIATGVVSLLTLASVTFSPSAQIQTPASQVHQESASVLHTVEKGETLQSIARIYFGSEEFWTTIWNTNPQIQNPSTIAIGSILTIRATPGAQTEELDPALEQRLNKIQEDVKKTVHIAPASYQSPKVSENPSPSVLNEEQINFLGSCESGMTATRNSGNGYYGAFQFSTGTWNSMNTGYERADLAPLEVQKEAVQRLLTRSSIHSQFPGCARKMQDMGLL